MTNTIKIYPADLNVFFQDAEQTPETIQQQKDIMMAVIDGAKIEDDAVVDCALAALLSSTYDIQSYNRSMAAYKKIREEHPEYNLAGDLAGSIQYNLNNGQNKKAKAYMLLSHTIRYDNSKQDIESKRQFLDTLNSISENGKLDSNLRLRSFLAAYTQTTDESDEVVSAIIRPFNKAVTETYEAPLDVTRRIAKIINAPEMAVATAWANKPKTITEATFLLSFQSHKLKYFIEESSDEKAKTCLGEEKAAIDTALETLKQTNSKAYEWGARLGEDCYTSYRIRNGIAQLAAETGDEVTQVNFPGGRLYAWGLKPAVT